MHGNVEQSTMLNEKDVPSKVAACENALHSA